ncbi:Phospholipase A(1) LCAT3 [Ananas comosus]|uniref:Phospholipase A(1) LCAT3 n=1 Tax=Ananas comosus TaxID=4615 RepID=A0A199VTS4_ANACO|nr:Phospholipase A(1) LCAT3 [Ananas comosus]
MFGDCGLRIPWLRRRRRRRRSGGGGGAGVEPVLLVSGMGGSILNARSKRSKRELRAWVRVFLANLEFKKYLWSMYNADTGYTEPLDSDVEICVPEDEYGLQAIDILDPSWWVKLLRVTDVYHFHDMIDMLVECGYEKGTTLFGYGYDFRQSNSYYEEQLRYDFSQVFAMYVNKWICIACPFQGAPGCINDSLLTGLQFVYGFESFFFVSRWNMHQLLVECPSIYEMLPYSNFKWNQQPLVQVWRKLSGENEEVKLQEYDATNCVSLFEEALRDNKLDYNGKSIPLPFNYSIFKWATDTRQILDNAQLPSAVSFYNIYGISLDTPYNVCYGSESSPIGDLSEICHTMPQYEYVDGDGTVPTESAKADGFAATARVGIKASHRGLLNDERVFQLLKQWLGAGEKSRQQPMSTSKVMDFSQESIPFQMAP